MSGESARHQATKCARRADRSTLPVSTSVCRPVAPAEDVQRHALKGVAGPNDRYLGGILVEVVGSLSSGLSIGSITTC